MVIKLWFVNSHPMVWLWLYDETGPQAYASDPYAQYDHVGINVLRMAQRGNGTVSLTAPFNLFSYNAGRT